MPAANESTPFEYLLSVDRQCIAHQGGLIRQEVDSEFSHGLAFNLGSHRYIIPISEITEVISVTEFTSIPRVPGWLIGIANVRGNLVTLLDLHQFIFNKQSELDMRTRRTLLIKYESHYFGLLIDSIIGMKSYQTDMGSKQVPDGFDTNHLDHIGAFYSSGEEWYAALFLDSLLLDERFQSLQ